MLRSKRVRAPDGTEWTVRRRWAPRPRWRRLLGSKDRRKKSPREKTGGIGDLADFIDLPLQALGDLGDGPPVLLLIVLAIAAIFFMIFVGIPLLIFLFETLLIIPVLLLIGAIARVLFRRPWTIEATASLPDASLPKEWKVVGWRASTQAASRMIRMIRAGSFGSGHERERRNLASPGEPWPQAEPPAR